MNEKSDQQLLSEFVQRRSESAFAEIVRRHLDLVYSAAMRMVRDPHTAQDVSQSVFVTLAGSAPQLLDRSSLAGWLHTTTRNLAAKAVRSEIRRREREQEAAVMNELLSADSEVSWDQIAPYLDEALGELNESDRDALLLRYFKNHDLRTVGATLGISDDTAQKRVSRAVERLREIFARRGVTAGTAALAGVISAHAVQAAPVGLALGISAGALTGTTLAATATVTATNAIVMTTLQKAIVTTTIAALAGVGIYETRRAALLKSEIESLQRQTPLIEQVQKMQRDRDEATNQLAALTDELASIKKGNTELLKLRGEVGLLRQQTNQLEKLAQALSAPRNSDNSPGETVEQSNFPRESWNFAGFDTPENTLQSFMWAKSRGDVTAAFSTGTPELIRQQKDLYFKNKSDEEISALLLDSAKKQTGFQILKKMAAADDQVVFQVHIDGTPEKSYALLTMNKIADEWKVSGVEERSDKPFAPSK